MVFKLSFPLDARTTRGKMIKTFVLDSNILDAPIQLSGNCATCLHKPNKGDEITCPICTNKFHTTCLTCPISSDYLKELSTNPCFWWCCTGCVKAAADESLDEPDDQAAKQGGAVNQVELQVLFQSFQSDLLKVVDEKLSVSDAKLSDLVEKKLETVVTNVTNDKCQLFAAVAAKKVETAAKNVENAAESIKIVSAGSNTGSTLGMSPNTVSPSLKSKETVVILSPVDESAAKSVAEVVSVLN